MRGEAEKQCINIIKNNKEIKNSKNYFGLQSEDIDEVVEAITKAKPNTNSSEFPDFVFENGFIEHFKVTSSKTNKKGSVHIKQEKYFKENVELEANELKRKWGKSVNDNQLHFQHWVMKYPEHNYNYLLESFKSNWSNHIKSFNNYKGNKNTSIFMIEYTDLALTMYEDVYHDWISGLSNGDLRKPEQLDDYRLSRDKRILEFIYKFKEDIKYIIFVYGKKYEVIKTSNIPYILKLMPWDYIIAPCMDATLVSSLYEIVKISL